MSRVLIIEDDSFKRDSLIQVVQSIVQAAKIESAADVRSAIRAINSNVYDLVIIDMALPSHSITAGGGSPMSLLTGGLEVILELSALARDDLSVIVTQYPEIELGGKFYPVGKAADEIRRQFSFSLKACIEYSEDSTAWQVQLSEVLRDL